MISDNQNLLKDSNFQNRFEYLSDWRGFFSSKINKGISVFRLCRKFAFCNLIFFLKLLVVKRLQKKNKTKKNNSTFCFVSSRDAKTFLVEWIFFVVSNFFKKLSNLPSKEWINLPWDLVIYRIKWKRPFDVLNKYCIRLFQFRQK